MGLAVGIDLGTTNSVVSTVHGGEPEVLLNSEGNRITPSVVAFTKTGERLVGELAKRQAVLNPDRTIRSIKRYMGTRERNTIDGKDYSPEEISAMILSKLKADAEMRLGEKVTDAVITVPAYFDDSQRTATKTAGEIAGFNVLRIINEPTAAAIAYGLDNKGKEETIIVYDLGGGTFDVTVLEVGEDELNVISTGGDHRLGGKDFDDRIMNYVEEEILERYKVELSGDKELEAELRLKAEAAKRQLTGRTSVPISLKVPKQGESGKTQPVKIEISRDTFNAICADLLDRTEMLLEAVMTKAGMEWKDINDVLCVGGSSRMPMVGEMLYRITGKKPLLHDPDECVAKGAAIQAALLSQDENLPHISVGHVLSHSLGVAVVSDGRPVIDHVVPSLTRLPTTQSRSGYTTTVDNQTEVQIRVYEGESNDPQSYGKGPIGVFQLDTSPARPKGQPKISVEFRCDENGRITAVARDEDTAKENYLNIALRGTRSESEVSEESKLMSEATIS